MKRVITGQKRLSEASSDTCGRGDRWELLLDGLQALRLVGVMVAAHMRCAAAPPTAPQGLHREQGGLTGAAAVQACVPSWLRTLILPQHGLSACTARHFQWL